MKFTKMHGLRNDYVLFDCFKRPVPKGFGPAMVSDVCDRRSGVGADGVLLLLPSKKADIRMRIFNIDGSEAEMCGNGVRCLSKYAFDRKIVRSRSFSVETMAGVKRIEVSAKNGKAVSVKVNMGAPELAPAKIPVLCKGNSLDVRIPLGGRVVTASCVSMGNPHCVVFVPDLSMVDVEKTGSALEKHKMFPKKTNVEFAEVLSRSKVRIRVWERGVGETSACGTGACATAVAAFKLGKTGRKVSIILPGGVLDISLAKDGSVLMQGPAEEVFDGEYDL